VQQVEQNAATVLGRRTVVNLREDFEHPFPERHEAAVLSQFDRSESALAEARATFSNFEQAFSLCRRNGRRRRTFVQPERLMLESRDMA